MRPAHNRTRGNQPYGTSPVLRVFLGVCILLGVVILAAILFAPDKPPAPPASEIRYEPAPSRPAPSGGVTPARGSLPNLRLLPRRSPSRRPLPSTAPSPIWKRARHSEA